MNHFWKHVIFRLGNFTFTPAKNGWAPSGIIYNMAGGTVICLSVFIYLLFFSGLIFSQSCFLCPGGLIRILLFYSIPQVFKLSLLNKGLVFYYPDYKYYYDEWSYYLRQAKIVNDI